jgi:glycine oxidase
MDHADVAIAGGGIIGLATALELARLGRKVTVFDRGEAMSEASRAAAGMLAGSDPENPPELSELAQLSLGLYPAFLSNIDRLCGRKIEIRTSLTVQGVRRPPRGATVLTDAEVQSLAPRAETAGWIFYRIDEESFDAWDLAEALPSAARAAGIDLREHCAVHGVRSTPSGVELETQNGRFTAGAFLNAAGAWSPSLEKGLPVSPRKGHMLTAELSGPLQMSCVLRTPAVYIVPRGANRYTIGPTLEDVGFDREVHPDCVHRLFEKAVELWPALRDARIAETWIGFRPGCPDGLPILDMTAPRCWIATGHFKNGIMLGPATGHILARWITGAEPGINLAPFRSARFAVSEVRF